MDKESDTMTQEEKHQIWMKNSGYLYDRLIVHKVKWPSLTFQWLPTIRQTQSSTIYQCLYATHTSGQRPIQHISIAQVELPHFKSMEDPETQMAPSVVRKVHQFNHQTEVNKARYYECDCSLIATRVEGPISIFRRGNEYPELILNDVNLGCGFGLEWTIYGLLSADHNGVIAIWQNIEQKPTLLKYREKIEDCKFIDANTFSTVGDDGLLCIWDLRSGKTCMEVKASPKQLYCEAVNPENKHFILTGGEDTNINLWDLRNCHQKLYKFQSHENSVISVQWSRKTPNIFASGSQDCKVKVWDLLRVGFEIPKDNSGTQQLLFTHEGHLGEVTDLDWNPYCMLLGSTEENGNTLQFYQISNCIQDIEYAEDIDYLRNQCLS